MNIHATQACYARVLDFKRKFIEAAQRYNELSFKTCIAEDEKMTALKNALICTILAGAGGWWHDVIIAMMVIVVMVIWNDDDDKKDNGIIWKSELLSSTRFVLIFPGQQRSRMLANLFKDERCQKLPAFAILEKMWLLWFRFKPTNFYLIISIYNIILYLIILFEKYCFTLYHNITFLRVSKSQMQNESW